MTGEQIKELTRIKKLIKENKRRFIRRKDRDYLNDLLDIGITINDVWNEILTLNEYYYIHDYLPFYNKDNNALIFKKIINGYKVYIKIKIERYSNIEEAVCLSFHKDKE